MALLTKRRTGKKFFFTFILNVKRVWASTNRPINTKRLEAIEEEKNRIRIYSNLKF